MRGMIKKLDYLAALGVKGLYIAGTPLKNLPWDFHYYNPIDFTLIDAHLGTLEDWRNFTDIAHSKGFYIVIDLTVSTAGDLLQFDG
jgi:alpha-1,3-glucan synthase